MDDYPCNDCPEAEHCDGWEARYCCTRCQWGYDPDDIDDDFCECCDSWDIREKDTRINLFLNEILNMNNITLSEDRESIVFSQKAINDALRIMFADTYKKKLSALRNQDTKRMNGN